MRWQFSMGLCFTWSIGRSTFNWSSSCTSAAPAISLLLFCALNTLPSEKKGLITITSSAGRHRLILLHTHSLPLYIPSIPHCPLPLPLLLNFTRDQCCCQAIYLFRVVPQTKGPQLPCHKYGRPAWTLRPGLVPDSDRSLRLMHVENSSYGNVTSFFPCKQTPFLSAAAGRGGMWIIKHAIELESTSLVLSHFI